MRGAEVRGRNLTLPIPDLLNFKQSVGLSFNDWAYPCLTPETI